VTLVEDIDGMVRNVTAAQLTALHLSASDARQRALDNLDELMKTGTVHMQVFPSGPQGKAFILAGGHWATASTMLLPGFRKVAAKALHDNDLLVSAPRRDAMLVRKARPLVPRRHAAPREGEGIGRPEAADVRADRARCGSVR
jgi:predicted cupin superfamily sugar epimerase